MAPSAVFLVAFFGYKVLPLKYQSKTKKLMPAARAKAATRWSAPDRYMDRKLMDLKWDCSAAPTTSK